MLGSSRICYSAVMKKSFRLLALTLSLSLCATGALRAAPIQELTGKQLRSALATAQVVEPRMVMQKVETTLGGQALDIRFFQSDGLYYRVLVKSVDGRLASVVVDAKSGKLMPSSTPAAIAVNAAAAGVVPQVAPSANANAAATVKGAGNASSTSSGVGVGVGTGTGTGNGVGAGSGVGSGNAGGNGVGNGNAGGNGNGGGPASGNAGGNGIGH